jgi:hypothetical protein
MKIIIPTADDSNITLTTEIEVVMHYPDGQRNTNSNIGRINMGKGMDGVHQGIFDWWTSEITKYFSEYWGVSMLEVIISDYSIIIQKNRNFKINGMSQSKANICHVLSRLTYASVNDKDLSLIHI